MLKKKKKNVSGFFVFSLPLLSKNEIQMNANCNDFICNGSSV